MVKRTKANEAEAGHEAAQKENTNQDRHFDENKTSPNDAATQRDINHAFPDREIGSEFHKNVFFENRMMRFSQTAQPPVILRKQRTIGLVGVARAKAFS